MRKTVGAGAISDCDPCTAGYYCLEQSEVETGECNEGYYCPTNITNPYGSDPPLVGSYGAEQVGTTGDKNSTRPLIITSEM